MGKIKIAVVYHSESGNTKKMAELVQKGCLAEKDVDCKIMPVDKVDDKYLKESQAVIMGSPTYEGILSWQMKKFLDEVKVDLAGKLGGVFASQNWPGGGGADLTEITIIAAMLVRGMLIYSGGISEGAPYLHFGAVSAKAPTGLYEERCVKLGSNIAKKAKEIYR